jgi:hypothetical protein
MAVAAFAESIMFFNASLLFIIRCLLADHNRLAAKMQKVWLFITSALNSALGGSEDHCGHGTCH